MVRIEVEYEGDLRTRCSHGPSSAKLATDAPVDNAGRGESFSPTDLLATAFATCMLTVMGIRAREEGWNIDGARAEVEKHMQTQPARRVGRLKAALELPAGLSTNAKRVLEDLARGCPVARSLHPDIELDITFHWAAESADV